jgi:hypothetical protein
MKKSGPSQCLMFVLLIPDTATLSRAQTITTLLDLDGTEGSKPKLTPSGDESALT